MNSELIERAKAYLSTPMTRNESERTAAELIHDFIAALSAPLPEEVAALNGRLQFRIAKLSGPGHLMPNCVNDLKDAKSLIERLARNQTDLRSYHKMHVDAESEIGELQQRIKELEAEVKSTDKMNADLQTAFDDCLENAPGELLKKYRLSQRRIEELEKNHGT